MSILNPSLIDSGICVEEARDPKSQWVVELTPAGTGEKSVFFNRVTLGISPTLQGKPGSGVVDKTGSTV